MHVPWQAWLVPDHPRAVQIWNIPSGKHTKNYGKSPVSMGKSTISITIFNSYVKLPEGNSIQNWNHQAMFDYTERFASLCYIA